MWVVVGVYEGVVVCRCRVEVREESGEGGEEWRSEEMHDGELLSR